MESKNIERLFQERLKDLEMNPSTGLWNKIERSLIAQNKSKKGFIWFWTGTGSIAALFLIGFLIFKSTPESKYLQAKNAEDTADIKNITTIKEALTQNISIKKTKINALENKNFVSVKDKISYKKTIVKPLKTKKETSIKNQIKTIKKENFIRQLNTPVLKNKKDEIKEKQSKLKKNVPIYNVGKTIKKDLLAEIEASKEVVNNKFVKKHWSIAPSLAQYFSNTFSNNSSIDPRLDNSKKSGGFTTSFGVNVAYQASRKIKIKTGIHKVDLQQTNVSNLIASADISAISSNSVDRQIQADALGSISVPRNSENQQLSDVSGIFRQDISYIEIPIELSFNLYQTNQLHFNFLGGFSTLFLTENNLQITRQGVLFSNGKSSNLNTLNFSFNLGTDVEYHFSNQWFFNISPTLKIQTQTFNKFNNKPYLIGVSTGINYKF